ncbi:MAG: RNA polymerase sigma factor [Verrucomicrobiota bacterium]
MKTNQNPSSIDFEAMVDAHYSGLQRFAVSLTKDSDAARDLVQHTFMQLSRYHHSLRDQSKVRSWLNQILYREFLKRRRKDQRLVIEEDQSPTFTLLESAPERHLFDDEVDAVRSSIERLDPVFRDAVRLRYFEGLDYAEIAERLKVPVGTIMSRLSRARNRLADMLRPTFQEAA